MGLREFSSMIEMFYIFKVYNHIFKSIFGTYILLFYLSNNLFIIPIVNLNYTIMYVIWILLIYIIINLNVSSNSIS